MAIRKILGERDGSLNKKSREVTVFDKRLHQLLDDMSDTLNTANGVGLAAVQVGVLRRAVIVDTGEGVTELINPKITARSEETACESEGCLSYPGLYGMVERPVSVTVEAQDRHGNLFTVMGEGLKARAFCHELDHLDGIVFKDIAKEMLEEDEEEE